MPKRLWQTAWPAETGAWWFYGKLPHETAKTLVVVIVNKSVNSPPKYFAIWVMNFYFEGELEGKWLKIDMPKLPQD